MTNLPNDEIEVVTRTGPFGLIIGPCRDCWEREVFIVREEQVFSVISDIIPRDRDQNWNRYWYSPGGSKSWPPLLARLKPDGSIDQSFPSFLRANFIAAQSDGKVIVTRTDGFHGQISRVLPVASAQKAQLHVFSYGAYETNGTVNVQVSRSGETSQPLMVRARTIELTATAGRDFAPQDIILEFASLQVTASIRVSLLDDNEGEQRTESFTVAFTAHSVHGEELLSAESTIWVYDDETSDSFNPSKIYMGRSASGILFLNFYRFDYSRKVETTEDFVTWTTLAEFPANGLSQMVVPQNRPYRFYRVRFDSP